MRTWKMLSGRMTYNHLLEALKGKGVKVTDAPLTLMQSPVFTTAKKRSDRLIAEFSLEGMFGIGPHNRKADVKDWNDVMHRTQVGRLTKVSPDEVVHFALQVSDREMNSEDWFVAIMHAVDWRVFTVSRRNGQFELGALHVGREFGRIYRNTRGIISADPRTENQDQIPWLGQSS